MKKQKAVLEKVHAHGNEMVKKLEEAQRLLHDNKIEAAMDSLESAMTNFQTVNTSLTPLAKKLSVKPLADKGMGVQDGLSHLVIACDKGEYGKAKEISQFTLMPRAKKWRDELNVLLAPHI
ncbi:hypothetical protein FLK61_37420 [Paenalkalicoccus suaedae]|uniref:DUF8042 domain-containing protein n=1 Tax=Paenalkalicoccus suaedae TaxID=2592382 RepID=A0A859FIY6_9BACI|nr:hypothetical protein [Paenalkalicoccus suaedae]QKS72316.1 hypothetical protein FLK61_37420 [Paenalkalicoccus suaedae]